MTFPKMAKIKQKFQTTPIQDIPKIVAEQFAKVGADDSIKPGMEVAITVGSRGIANIPSL
ncbi:hypothetical protein [Pontibacillus sp. HMF3514]|uniref:hypothetical protein n=1 Tax=Pontibacillus sp. HMF3514 TaxID=2692425 RepID=UPI001F43641D|nr:hypothetical protein [Pontibacillus sp. HMF3514]